MRRRAFRIPILILLLLSILAPSSFASDRIQRSVAIAQVLVPLGYLLVEGTDNTLEIVAFGGTVLLQTIPNAALLLAESTQRGDLTRIARWVNFGIDSGLAAGLAAVGISHLAGAFGPEPDTRAAGAYYLALSIPAGIAAFSDFLPYTVEGPRPARDRSDQ